LTTHQLHLKPAALVGAKKNPFVLYDTRKAQIRLFSFGARRVKNLSRQYGNRDAF